MLAARAEVQVSGDQVSSRLQVSGVDNKHGQEVSTVRAEVSAAGVSEVLPRCGRCQQQGAGVRCQ